MGNANETQQALMQPDELAPQTERLQRILDEMDRLLIGRHELHRMVLAGILSRGHILLEGLPGLGKTALVTGFGKIMDLDFSRVQFTPDLMPGDIVGTHILQQNQQGERTMVFQKGPVFTNILLADEINRASPKTQSALLETMQERSVTLMGTTHKLPSPFFVMASQNPIELEGTYPLPEAQLDRFLFKIPVMGLDADVLETIVSTRRRGECPEPQWRLTADGLNELFQTMDRVFLPSPVSRYIAQLVSASHSDAASAPDGVKQYVKYGASPRAAIGIAEAARAYALIEKRPTVGFNDVKSVAPLVLNHRMILNYKARFDEVDTLQVIDELLRNVSETGLDLPERVELAEATA